MIRRIKVFILSTGVLFLWLWCFVASFICVRVLIDSVFKHRPTEALMALGFELMPLALAFLYPRWLTPVARKLTGQDPWFRHPLRFLFRAASGPSPHK